MWRTLGLALLPLAQCTPLLSDFDALGAWYAELADLPSQPSASKSNATIAIVGGGVSGLATGMMLDSIGMHNWEIIEGSSRIGGRFRTKYVGNSSEWAEMGPMRLPHSIKYKSDNSTHLYTDHQMVFQLADELNKMNKDKHPHLNIDFIRWIQHSPNELLARGTGRHPDGRVPTRAEIEANSSLAVPPPLLSDEYKDIKAKMNNILMNETRLRDIQRNVWAVHGDVMAAGYDDWSEQAMMRDHFGASENVTDAVLSSTDYNVFWDEMVHNSNIAQHGGRGTVGLTEWKCVDKGFSRISEAFEPHVSDRLTLNRRIQKLEPVTDRNGKTQTRLSWFSANRSVETKDYDYTIMTAPFTMTRLIDLPKFSSVLNRAIGERGLEFKDACKVALLFKERFWEKGSKPIYGGYSQPESEAIGALYYPSYNTGEDRPGVIIHYRGGDWSSRFTSLSEEEHVNMVLDAIVSLHGEHVRDLYTGKYERLCWLEDELAATSWCRPKVEQHKLYIPSYHRTEHNTIFIGEHTAPTHAWVSSSLYSAVRGTAQLLLELGMVTEAQTVTKQWMGRWMGLNATDY